MRQTQPAAGRLKPIADWALSDLEAVRLLLRGDSVIDWHRLNFEHAGEVTEFLAANELALTNPGDAALIDHVKQEAVDFLRRHFEFPIPRPVEALAIDELMLLASGKGHRQLCACTILKVMHIIHHLEGRELLFMLPLSDQEVFHLVEEKVYRVVGGMLAAGMPITEFVGGRKNKYSVYTKLLSKQENIAAQIYDKLRFRIVTRSRDDIFPVLHYLTRKLFPFNYVIPGESTNTVFPMRSYCEAHPSLRALVHDGRINGEERDDLTPSANTFSDADFSIIHFVVDLPIRVPSSVLDAAPATAGSLGPVFFALTEFQIVDRETEMRNETGEASHDRYKERQRQAVMRRLKLGSRGLTPKASHVHEPSLPPMSTRSGRASVLPSPTPSGSSTGATSGPVSLRSRRGTVPPGGEGGSRKK